MNVSTTAIKSFGMMTCISLHPPASKRSSKDSTTRPSSSPPTSPSFEVSSDTSSDTSSQTSAINSTSLSHQDFILARAIGRGSFGTVYLAQHANGSSIHAVKVVKKSRLDAHSGDASLIVNEQRVSKRLEEVNSPFFLQLHASFHDTENYYFITRYMAAGDLGAEIRFNMVPFSSHRVQFYMAELVHCIDLLHKLRIIHRDIKLQNIFIDTDGHLVLGDFGLSRMFSDSDVRSSDRLHEDDLRALIHMSGHRDHTKHWCGTVGYMAPELYLGQWYTYSSDIWSLGVVMFEMLFNQMPWDGDSPRAVIESTLNDPLFVPIDVPTDYKARNLLYSLLAKDSIVRPDINSIKKHPYFEDIDWDKVAKRKLECPWRPKLPKSIKPFARRERPLIIRTGFSYIGAEDPEPAFAYVSPKAQYLIRGQVQARNPIQAAIGAVSTMFGYRKLSCFPNKRPDANETKDMQMLALDDTNRRSTVLTQEPPPTPGMQPSGVQSAPVKLAAPPPSQSSSNSAWSPLSVRAYNSGLHSIARAMKVKTGWTPSAKLREGSERRILGFLE